MWLAHAEFQPIGTAELCAAAGKKPIRIMRLQPVAQELGRNRDMYDAAVIPFQLNTAKPAREDVVTKLSPQPALYPPPFMFD
jgi:hypothetical protein